LLFLCVQVVGLQVLPFTMGIWGAFLASLVFKGLYTVIHIGA